MTLALINKHIKHLNVYMVKGKGYFYFLDTNTNDQVGDSVPVCYLKHLSLDKWIKEAEYARGV